MGRQQREFRERSRLVRESLFGSHNQGLGGKSQRSRFSRNSDNQGFGTTKRVLPRSMRRDAYAGSSVRFNYYSQANRRRRRNLIILAVLLVAAALALAAAVSWFTFQGGLNSAVMLDDDSVQAALTQPEDASSPYWVLIAGEFDDGSKEYDGPGLVDLVHINPQTGAVAVISIPSDTTVSVESGGVQALSHTQVTGGDAQLIAAVEELAGVQIAHFCKIDAEGFVRLVDGVGGVEVDVAYEVDDPDAGALYIAPGTQTLSGEQALVYCRADNYRDPVATRASAQVNVMRALVSKAASGDRMELAHLVDEVGETFKTDMEFNQLAELAALVSDDAALQVYSAAVPGVSGVDADGTYYIVDADSLAAMIAIAEADGDPSSVQSTPVVDSSSISVDILNGGGVSGIAAEAQSLLAGLGYQIESVGNAESYAYDETLIVYRDNANEDAAEAIAAALENCRVVQDAGYYDFSTDVLVIVGSDWVTVAS